MKYIRIIDLDKTSLYCPLALKFDNSPLKNLLHPKLFYGLYSFVYILEFLLGKFKVNSIMQYRIKHFSNNVENYIITARHKSLLTKIHCYLLFGKQMKDIKLICTEAGFSKKKKYEFIQPLIKDDNCTVIMYDDNEDELQSSLRNLNTNHLQLYYINFDGFNEKLELYYAY